MGAVLVICGIFGSCPRLCVPELSRQKLRCVEAVRTGEVCTSGSVRRRGVT